MLPLNKSTTYYNMYSLPDSVFKSTCSSTVLQTFELLNNSVTRFAGNMDRTAAKNLLMPRSDGTFLVRQKDGGEFAISIK